jgi:LPXTG-motif cell wall-anchored protein
MDGGEVQDPTHTGETKVSWTIIIIMLALSLAGALSRFGEEYRQDRLGWLIVIGIFIALVWGINS